MGKRINDLRALEAVGCDDGVRYGESSGWTHRSEGKANELSKGSKLEHYANLNGCRVQ